MLRYRKKNNYKVSYSTSLKSQQTFQFQFQYCLHILPKKCHPIYAFLFCITRYYKD